MNHSDFTKHLDERRISYRVEAGRVIVDHKGSVYLDSLTGQHTYRGNEYTFMHVDGCTNIIFATKQKGDISIHTAAYFGGGEVADLKRCYIAQRGDLHAHGDTVKTAIRDLQFKLDRSLDVSEHADAVKTSGRVTLSQFRCITGACEDGVRQHLAGHGYDLDALDDMPLADALKAMAGTSYGDEFKTALEQVR